MKIKLAGAVILGFLMGVFSANTKFFYEVLNFIETNPSSTALFVTVLLVIIPWASHLKNQKTILMQQDFINYHKIISELVSGRNNEVFLDSQIACVYELSHFVAYKENSKRILRHLKNTWSTSPSNKLKNQSLLDEIDLTLKDLDEK